MSKKAEALVKKCKVNYTHQKLDKQEFAPAVILPNAAPLTL